MKLNELIDKAKLANTQYRIGKPIMTDSQYDELVEQIKTLDPENKYLSDIGHLIEDNDSRKKRLPIVMASMDKCKSFEEIVKWARLKGISLNENFILTPKLDGLSFCVDEEVNNAFTRGDGEFGQQSNEHYKLINNKYTKIGDLPFKYTYGEVIMKKSVFEDKYSHFANPRNLVAGILNSKDPNNMLLDCNYIKYGVEGIRKDFKTKEDILIELNKGQKIQMMYYVDKLSNLSDEFLIGLFKAWHLEYEIDGIIIEINSLELQEKLGRERSTNNPSFARAYKHPSFEQCKQSTVTGISWNISKQGLLKPIIHINPIKLDGVTVSNVTGNNAKFIKDMGIGVGAEVMVKRSGMVIPLIVSVVKPVDFEMPNIDNIDWNENGIELITLIETEEQKFQKIVAFFEILEAKNVSEGILKQLWDNGYKTLEDILNLKEVDLEGIERFGKRKASIVYNSIQSCINGVTLSKLQHATGIFKGLGSKKLLLLEHFDSKPNISDVMSIEGFAEKSAKSYIDGYDRFFEFIKHLPIQIKKQQETLEKVSDDLNGNTYVFTGVRSKELEEIITSRGGKIGNSVSKTTTHLIMKAKGSGSAKEEKAIELGITILTLDELKQLL